MGLQRIDRRCGMYSNIWKHHLTQALTTNYLTIGFRYQWIKTWKNRIMNWSDPLNTTNFIYLAFGVNNVDIVWQRCFRDNERNRVHKNHSLVKWITGMLVVKRRIFKRGRQCDVFFLVCLFVFLSACIYTDSCWYLTRLSNRWEAFSVGMMDFWLKIQPQVTFLVFVSDLLLCCNCLCIGPLNDRNTLTSINTVFPPSTSLTLCHFIFYFCLSC